MLCVPIFTCVFGFPCSSIVLGWLYTYFHGFSARHEDLELCGEHNQLPISGSNGLSAGAIETRRGLNSNEGPAITQTLSGEWMSPLDAALENLISRHALTLKCAAIIHASVEVTNRVGDFTEFDHAGLASAVLGPYGDPCGSFQLAAQFEDDRKMLPQGMG